MTEQEKRLESILTKLDSTFLKDLQGYKCRNILFNNIIPLFQYGIWKRLLRLLKRLFFDSADITYKQGQSKVLLITLDYGREDYNEYWKLVREIYGGNSELVVSENARRFVPLPEWPISIQKYFVFVRALGIAGLDGIRFVLAADLVRSFRLIKRLDRLNISPGVSLIFFDGNCTENTITQYFSLHGAKTITMQHGQPVFHGLGTDHLNQTMILNMTADYVIVPGDFSKKQFMAGGIPESRIKVLGTLRPREKYKDSKSNVFVVFLNCPTLVFSKASNMELVQIAEAVAKKLNLTYKIKLHPQDEVWKYSDVMMTRGSFAEKDISIKELLDKAAFSLLNFSGVYIDSITNGKKAFVLKKYLDYYMTDEDLDLFYDTSSLIEKIKRWIAMDTVDKENYISEVQNHYLGSINSTEQHKNFIASLV